MYWEHCLCWIVKVCLKLAIKIPLDTDIQFLKCHIKINNSIKICSKAFYLFFFGHITVLKVISLGLFQTSSSKHTIQKPTTWRQSCNQEVWLSCSRQDTMFLLSHISGHTVNGACCSFLGCGFLLLSRWPCSRWKLSRNIAHSFMMS